MPLENYLLVATILFAIGVVGVLMRRNALVVMMCLELMLSASIIALVAFSRFNATAEVPMMGGNVLVLFVIAVAACEVPFV